MKYVRRLGWVLYLLPIFSHPIYGQSRTAHPMDAALARPISWGDLRLALFANDTGPHVMFRLETSWIPGERHAGMFRYKLWVIPTTSPVERVKNADAYSPEAIAIQMKRIHSCSIYLNVHDKDDFLLRTVQVPFTYGADDQARIDDLMANLAVQMDASEYRQINSWSISWSCPPEP